MRHHSGSDDYPIRGLGDFLKDLDDTDDPATLQKLKIEATIHLAWALGTIADAISRVGSLDSPVYGSLDVVVKEP
jgi:hypothetical protein